MGYASAQPDVVQRLKQQRLFVEVERYQVPTAELRTQPSERELWE